MTAGIAFGEGGGYFLVMVLTALHLIAFLCGGRVAHVCRLMVVLVPGFLPLHKSLSDAKTLTR